MDLSLSLHLQGDAPPVDGVEIDAWRGENGAVFARALADGAERWIVWPGLGAFGFSPGSSTVRAWPDAGVCADVVRDVFARVLQPVILQALGCQALHASAVIGAEGVLAFCGVGHSGKSTLAYALGRSGYRQVADDALVLEVSDRAVRTRLLPFRSQLREASTEYFAGPAGARDEPWPAVAGNRQTAILRAIFLLRQDGSVGTPAVVRRLDSVEAFPALLAHAHCFDERDAEAGRRLIEDYLTLAEQVAVFAVGYVPDYRELPALTRLIASMASEIASQHSQPILRDRAHP